MLIRFLTCLLISLIAGSLSARETIARVELSGLKRTNADFVLRMVQSSPGAELDSLVLAEDVQRLRNVRLFSEVEAVVTALDSGVEVRFVVRENLTVLPISNFGRIDDGFWFQLGLIDHNWLGRGNTLAGYYRYYDRSSFETYLLSPYLFGDRWGLDANLNFFATSEPTNFGGANLIYDVDRWAAIALLRHRLSDYRTVQFGGGYLLERYRKQIVDPLDPGPGPARAEFDKYLLKITLVDSRLNYYAYLLDGFTNELFVESIKTAGERAIFWKIEDIFRFYRRMWSGANAAFRLRLGIARNDNTPFAPFVLDSYLTVRGAGNRVARGTAEATANIEFRQAFLENGWMAMQAVAFADFSGWRPAGTALNRLFRKENTVSFLGVGGRLYLKRVNHLILRLDFGFSVTESRQNGLVIGLGQYF